MTISRPRLEYVFGNMWDKFKQILIFVTYPKHKTQKGNDGCGQFMH